VSEFASILALKIARLDEPPDYVKVEQTQEPTGDRAGVRGYTGTIPDYATEVEGLRLSGVVAGGPAERAGLREGDVIVEFAGRKIANIYDYTYALDAIKVGEPVPVVCLREGERVELTITPTARP
jgi:S1-C subfamily serine protease